MILDSEWQRTALLGILKTVNVSGIESAERLTMLSSAIRSAKVPKPTMWQRIRRAMSESS